VFRVGYRSFICLFPWPSNRAKAAASAVVSSGAARQGALKLTNDQAIRGRRRYQRILDRDRRVHTTFRSDPAVRRRSSNIPIRARRADRRSWLWSRAARTAQVLGRVRSRSPHAVRPNNNQRAWRMRHPRRSCGDHGQGFQTWRSCQDSANTQTNTEAQVMSTSPVSAPPWQISRLPTPGDATMVDASTRDEPHPGTTAGRDGAAGTARPTW